MKGDNVSRVQFGTSQMNIEYLSSRKGKEIKEEISERQKI